MFDVKKLLTDVFDPQAGEVVTFAVDLPHDDVPDHQGWSARRMMAERWRSAMEEIAAERAFTVRPILSFEASGALASTLSTPFIFLRISTSSALGSAVSTSMM